MNKRDHISQSPICIIPACQKVSREALKHTFASAMVDIIYLCIFFKFIFFIFFLIYFYLFIYFFKFIFIYLFKYFRGNLNELNGCRCEVVVNQFIITINDLNNNGATVKWLSAEMHKSLLFKSFLPPFIIETSSQSWLKPLWSGSPHLLWFVNETLVFVYL